MDNTQNKQNTFDNQKLVNFFLFLVLIISLGALISLYASRGVRHYKPPTTIVIQKDAYEDTSLIARAAIVYDINNKKVLYQKNANDILALASVTKIMTAVTALELLDYSNVITIKKEFLAQEGDSGLLSDERWNFKDLLDFSLVISSNDGSAAIASAAGAFIQRNNKDLDREVFIEKMNKKAKEIGMNTASFYNETGLDEPDGKNGGYASVRDLATLFEYALRNYPTVLEATKEPSITVTSESNFIHRAINTNTAVNEIPNLIGSKTGFTDTAGGNLGIIFDAGVNRPIAIIVLASTLQGRFSDVETLTQKTLESISQE
jgi:D-alanyl-D-alanine carboxypeptidase (penicillin-binding protein 5/6)